MTTMREKGNKDKYNGNQTKTHARGPNKGSEAKEQKTWRQELIEKFDIARLNILAINE